MGTRQLNRLTFKAVTSKTKPGLYCDGGGLYLQVTATGSKTWIFRYRSPTTRKTRDMGLGAFHSVPLPEVREKVGTHRKAILDGLDPIDTREEAARRAALSKASAVTFDECAASFLASHKAGWKNAKHAEQWESTLDTYASPVFGKLPVQDVDTGLVLKVLEPIWSGKPETASRLRGRIENVLDWAKARGYRSGENPACWKGHLKQLLPTLAKRDRVTHFKAMPFPEVAAFVTLLREQSSISARCLEFTILTAARTGESIAAKVEEFDLDNATWTVPASRMKAGKEHRVPLSQRAVEIVREMLNHGQPFVFAGMRDRTSISNMAMLQLLDRMHVEITVHGFRSTFRDWASERTAFPREVCEMALAHTITNAAEAAYRRGDLFEKRRKLRETWAEFVAHPQVEGTVVPLMQPVQLAA